MPLDLIDDLLEQVKGDLASMAVLALGESGSVWKQKTHLKLQMDVGSIWRQGGYASNSLVLGYTS
jgi:hypothetical protein